MGKRGDKDCSEQRGGNGRGMMSTVEVEETKDGKDRQNVCDGLKRFYTEIVNKDGI